MTQEVRVARHGAVLRVLIDRPEKRNALSRPVLRALAGAFEDSAADAGLALAVLQGAGDRCFAAGGDLRDLEQVRDREQADRMAAEAHDCLDAIRRFPVPVVAALNGDALGGGAELAVACDFRVAAADAGIGFIQGRLNITTAWGGGTDLMQLAGPSRALGLLCRSERLDAARALELGLVDAVAAPDEALEQALERFIAPLLRQAPQVLRGFKALAGAARRGEDRAALLATERRHLVETWVHEDHWAAAARALRRR